jgi:hypothetical protein
MCFVVFSPPTKRIVIEQPKTAIKTGLEQEFEPWRKKLYVEIEKIATNP